MSWVHEQLGAGAILYPGSGLKDHARAAVQMLSPNPRNRTVHAHLGWRTIGGQSIYLHAGGAIDSNGSLADIEVEVDRALAKRPLPELPTGDGLKHAVLASLQFLDVAPREVTFTLLAAAYRAALQRRDFSISHRTDCALERAS